MKLVIRLRAEKLLILRESGICSIKNQRISSLKKNVHLFLQDLEFVFYHDDLLLSSVLLLLSLIDLTSSIILRELEWEEKSFEH